MAPCGVAGLGKGMTIAGVPRLAWHHLTQQRGSRQNVNRPYPKAPESAGQFAAQPSGKLLAAAIDLSCRHPQDQLRPGLDEAPGCDQTPGGQVIGHQLLRGDGHAESGRRGLQQVIEVLEILAEPERPGIQALVRGPGRPGLGARSGVQQRLAEQGLRWRSGQQVMPDITRTEHWTYAL